MDKVGKTELVVCSQQFLKQSIFFQQQQSLVFSRKLNLFSFSQERSGLALSNKIRNKTKPLPKLLLKAVKIAIGRMTSH